MKSKSGGGTRSKVRPNATLAGEARQREREARLAEALRENLRRRKADAVGRRASLVETLATKKDG